MKFHLIVVLLFLKTCVKDYGDRGLVIIYREGGAGAMENMPSLIFADPPPLCFNMLFADPPPQYPLVLQHA